MNERRNGQREGPEGGGAGSSLMKQKIKGKNCTVFCFAGKKKLLFYIYAVIVKQKIYKRSSNYYSRRQAQGHTDSAEVPGFVGLAPGGTQIVSLLYY